jgi:hypothetical protein
LVKGLQAHGAPPSSQTVLREKRMRLPRDENVSVSRREMNFYEPPKSELANHSRPVWRTALGVVFTLITIYILLSGGLGVAVFSGAAAVLCWGRRRPKNDDG